MTRAHEIRRLTYYGLSYSILFTHLPVGKTTEGPSTPAIACCKPGIGREQRVMKSDETAAQKIQTARVMELMKAAHDAPMHYVREW